MELWPGTPPPHKEPVAPLTRAEIEEAICHLRATMLRAPKVMSERYHKQLDDLLDQRDAAVLEETYKLPDA